MDNEKCERCNGKGKRGLVGRRCAWCKGTGAFQPGPCPTCDGKGRVRASPMGNEPSGFGFHAHAQTIGLDGKTTCTKCDGTGTSINRRHSAIGDK